MAHVDATDVKGKYFVSSDLTVQKPAHVDRIHTESAAAVVAEERGIGVGWTQVLLSGKLLTLSTISSFFVQTWNSPSKAISLKWPGVHR